MTTKTTTAKKESEEQLLKILPKLNRNLFLLTGQDWFTLTNLTHPGLDLITNPQIEIMRGAFGFYKPMNEVYVSAVLTIWDSFPLAKALLYPEITTYGLMDLMQLGPWTVDEVFDAVDPIISSTQILFKQGLLGTYVELPRREEKLAVAAAALVREVFRVNASEKTNINS